MTTKKAPKHAASTAPAVLPEQGSDEWVEVLAESGKRRETAAALLEAAEHVGLDPQRAVRTIDAGFRVPRVVLEAADLTDAAE